MDIIDLAKELGLQIGSSKEMIYLKDSEVALEADEKAKTLMEEYKQLQLEMVKVTRAKKEPEVVEAVKTMLLKKQEELNNYSVTANYLEAKSGFDQLMKNVNDVIIFGITGDEPCSPSKCGSCSGCK